MGLFSQKREEAPSKFPYTQSMLYLRVAIGGYLAYLSYSLVVDYFGNPEAQANSTMPLLVLVIVALLFGVVGVIVGIVSIKKIVKGEFKGGKADVDEFGRPYAEMGMDGEETTVEEQSAPKKGLFAKEEPVKKSISEFAKYNNEATDDVDDNEE